MRRDHPSRSVGLRTTWGGKLNQRAKGDGRGRPDRVLVSVSVGVQWGADEDSDDLTCPKRQDRRAAHSRPEGMVAVEAEEPVKAVRESGEDGLGEVPRGISRYKRALAGAGKGYRQDGERAGGSLIHPGPDGGIHAQPIDTAEDGRLLEPLPDPDNVWDIAVTGGYVD